jgi:O-antigen biosynthesis protein
MNSVDISVSIIIPNYNGRNLLAKHLPAVVHAAGNAEIIVVDDASTDDSVAYLKKRFPQIKIMTHSKNLRFAAACNTGVAAATGEVVVLLNTDVSPEPDFLPPLIRPFADANVFAVGCAEYGSHTQMVSGRAGGAFKRGLIVHWRSQNQKLDTTFWVTGGSGAFRKSMWQQLNGMDSLFAPAYEEDRDICYRALKRGWHIKFAPQSRVYHEHEHTNQKELGNRRMQTASLKNHLILVWKNITSPALFAQHLAWLPYHLTITNLRTGGLFLPAFMQALASINQIANKRAIESKEEVISDETILASYSH